MRIARQARGALIFHSSFVPAPEFLEQIATYASSESLYGTVWCGCLSRHEFALLAEATVISEEWPRIYNEIRPHSRLGYRPRTSAYLLERQAAA